MALSAKAKAIGERPAFPVVDHINVTDKDEDYAGKHDFHHLNFGMTYRHWLIGKYALAGFIGAPEGFRVAVIARVDAVLEALAAEEKEG